MVAWILLVACNGWSEPEAGIVFEPETQDKLDCENGDATACLRAGTRAVKQGKTEIGIQWLDRACQEDVSTSCEALGNALLDQPQPDGTRARDAFRKACEDDSREACNNLGHVYSKLLGEPTEGVRWFEHACGQGDALACINLGNHLADGHGVPRDDSRAVVAYEKACTLGHLPGCTNEAIMVMQGLGAPIDYSRAEELFAKACGEGRGEAMACFNAGLLWYSGDMGRSDLDKASSYFAKACDLGHGNACYGLGMTEGDRGRDGTVHYKAGCALGSELACERLGVSANQ
jgi:hypothetical protein